MTLLNGTLTKETLVNGTVINETLFNAKRVNATEEGPKGEHEIFDISTSDLDSLLKTDHFIDKTELVKVFFQSTPMIMVTAPRRFGNQLTWT